MYVSCTLESSWGELERELQQMAGQGNGIPGEDPVVSQAPVAEPQGVDREDEAHDQEQMERDDQESGAGEIPQAAR